MELQFIVWQIMAIFFSIFLATGFIYGVYQAFTRISKEWNARDERIRRSTYRNPRDEELLQVDVRKNCCSKKFYGLLRWLGISRMVDLVDDHNHRALSQLDKIRLAAGVGDTVWSGPKMVWANSVAGDRDALEKFFVSTHSLDPESWSNESGSGSGRLGWLDKDLDIRLWQGVAVDPDGSKTAGRVSKVYLPRNRIVGPIGALMPLTNMRKLSLWSNRLTGDLSFLIGMALLKELDLHDNQLTVVLAFSLFILVTSSQVAQALELTLRPSACGCVDVCICGHVCMWVNVCVFARSLLGCSQGTLAPLATHACLEDLHLGDNRLGGGLAPLAGAARLRRLNLSGNALAGELCGLEPCADLEVVDLSRNAALWGTLPGGLHRRWVDGTLPCATAGTRIGSRENGSPLVPREASAAPPEPAKKPPPPRGLLRRVVPERLTAAERAAAAEAHVAKALEQQQQRLATMRLETSSSKGAGGGAAGSASSQQSSPPPRPKPQPQPRQQQWILDEPAAAGPGSHISQKPQQQHPQHQPQHRRAVNASEVVPELLIEELDDDLL